jgi:membrane-associated phospholipid phosphatase
MRNTGALGGEREDSLVNRFKFGPYFTPYVNDPSGFFRYSLGIYGAYTRMLSERLYLDLYGTWTLSENISGVTQPSNSLLPHVRSDIADYKAAADVKLQSATVTRYFKPTERVLSRFTGGLLEEMFGGVEAQAMYVPRHNRWAADLWVDWVKQRDFDGWGWRDYSTVTALASYHQRLVFGLTGTVRAGRFLAKDEGARFEIKRRFRSGFEVGAWYTWTNGNDITPPGSPGNPYHDKGVWMRIPLETMLPADTQAEAVVGFSPWTRDVGQMVLSPRDLYWNFEKGQLFDVYEGDGLSDFADRRDDYALATPQRVWDQPLFERTLADASDTVSLLGDRRAWRALGIGLGLTVAAGAVLDRDADRWARDNGRKSAVETAADVGNALPYVALGGAVFGALQDWDTRLARTSVTALEAGLGSWALAEGLAWAIGRAAPTAGQGPDSFSPFGQGSSGSLPSGHTAAIWATVTPYAREYDMPWLYGVAALTNFARVADRDHWLSDTVGSALLGYGIGSLLWHWHRQPGRAMPAVGIGPNSVNLAWELE